MWSPGTPREDAGGMRAVKDEKKMWKGTHGGPFKGQTMPAYCRKLKKNYAKSIVAPVAIQTQRLPGYMEDVVQQQ